MSWIFAALAHDAIGEMDYALHHAKPIHLYRSPTLYMAAGGLPDTCLSGKLKGKEEGCWVIAGLGIKRDGGGVAFLLEGDWAERFSTGASGMDTLDGHFVGVRCTHDRIDAFTDALGMRTLYAVRMEDRTLLSTRLDWIARASGISEIDFSSFGSYWMGMNQFEPRSLLRGIERLGPGGLLTCTPEGLHLHSTPFEPGPAAQEDPVDLLRAFTWPELAERTGLTLGLSGGLDSRLLLALLLDRGRSFQTHVFGAPDDPDVVLSEQIARSEGIRRRRLQLGSENIHEVIERIETLACQKNAASPASAALRMGPYEPLHEQGLVMIDGGMGEIGRRRYLNRLLRRGSFHRSAASGILPHVLFHRANLFTPDTTLQMRQGLESELDAFLDTLPAGVSDAHKADLFAVRSRFPNLSGLEQARLDGIIVNYMPFAQPSFIRAVLHTPLESRRNGRLYRHTIRTLTPRLQRFPLVKGNTTYPYSLPSLAVTPWVQFKNQLGLSHRDTFRTDLLFFLRDYVQDLANSSSARSFAHYDYKLLQSRIARFYRGEKHLAAELDWWLSFEIWRRGLS